MEKVKLSELDNNQEVSYEWGNAIFTVDEMKEELKKDSRLKDKQWYTVKHKKWEPNAKEMIEDYIENESQNMYEDWDEGASDCVTRELVQKIQSLLEESFEGCSDYWLLENEIIL